MVKKIKKNSSYSYNDRNVKPTFSTETTRSLAKDFPDIVNENAKSGKRVIAYAIDLLTYVPVAGLFHFTTLNLRQVGGAENERNAMYMMLAIVVYALLLFGYLPNKWQGQTIGKKLLKIRMVPINNQKVEFSKYIIREFLIKIVLGWICVPVILAHGLYKKLFEKQDNITLLHDKLLQTRVVEISQK
ncbi:RDD family protein [Gemella bergeri]